MSRVGKNPIVLPAGVEITFGEQITVKGPLGTLQIAANDAVEVKKEGQEIVVSKVEGAVNASAMWGTMRANLNNMVTGVSKGFEKKLQLVGVASVPRCKVMRSIFRSASRIRSCTRCRLV